MRREGKGIKRILKKEKEEIEKKFRVLKKAARISSLTQSTFETYVSGHFI